MPTNRPLLRFKPAREGKREKGPRPHFSKTEFDWRFQGRRLASGVDERLRDILNRGIDAETYRDPDAIAPERALVFEVYGALTDFARTAQRIGLDWLADEIVRLDLPEEIEEEIEFEDEFLEDAWFDAIEIAEIPERRGDVTGRLYVSMPTIESMRKLLTLWDIFKDGGSAPDGYSDWWSLFKQLKDLRAWGPRDRLSVEAETALRAELGRREGQPQLIELDLWFRNDAAARQRAWTRLRQSLDAVAAEVVDDAEIPEIRYHAALVRVSPELLAEILARQGDIVMANEVMSIRPQSIASLPPVEDDGQLGPVMAAPVPNSLRPAIAALLDGLPVENHTRLAGRIDVFDTGDLPPTLASQRFHGTGMASLILHGDLDANEPPIDRLLHIVPVLSYDPIEGRETTPSDKLPLKLIYEAVIRMKKGIDDAEPTAPQVFLINHSIGDVNERLLTSASPWARTLDYLSYTYRVLFIVSAGNCEANLEVQGFSSIQQFLAADPVAREHAMMRALDANKATRALLAPAEAVNALTVGALHRDLAGALPGNVVDPFPTLRMCSLLSRLGLGLRNSVKPELMGDGGRAIAQPTAGAPLLIRAHAPQAVGQRVSAPHRAGDLTHTVRSCGTSNAAALTTRAGIRLSDALDDAIELTGAPPIPAGNRAVVVKTLLAHSAAWGNAGDYMETNFQPQGKKGAWLRRRENISRFL
ncbi:MAG TPA: S8 family peptidase, partial [Azospirillaceae bacterium]|nr:S8 family peptidase [Azospirillaceae bacterium]